MDRNQYSELLHILSKFPVFNTNQEKINKRENINYTEQKQENKTASERVDNEFNRHD